MESDWIFHNSHNKFYRHPFGSVPCNEKINLRVKIETYEQIDTVVLRLWKNNNKEVKVCMHQDKEQQGIYQVEIVAPSNPGLLWYYFMIFMANGKIYYYGNNHKSLGGRGEIKEHPPHSYQITVYKENTSTPAWFKDAIMYQIFVDRFYNGHGEGEVLNPRKDSYIHSKWDDLPFYIEHPYNGKIIYDFFGGNLLGVIKKLHYLKELGINTIYLNPIFESISNHKYDPADYKKIDPMFGDNQIFQTLCDKAKDLGIKIILDGVFSHTGSDSIYFNKEGNYPSLGAYQSPDSPYYTWYKFGNCPDEYECWWDIKIHPNVNELDPSYLDFIIKNENSVAKYWLKHGAKGWRLDVADELPDEFIKEFRQAIKKEDPDSVLIGEVWEDASNKISYGKQREFLWGEELDSIMNYPFRNALLDFILGKKDAEETHLSLMNIYENYPLENFYSNMNLIGTHDVPRILSLLGEVPWCEESTRAEQARVTLNSEQKRLAINRLKLLSLIQMTFPGVPVIYYGDEAGMEGLKDPLNRGSYPWGKENEELLNWYKKIIFLRNYYDVLKTGTWVPIYTQGDVYGYLRKIAGGKDVFNQKKNDNVAIVLINRNPKRKIDLSIDVSEWCGKSITDVLLQGEQEVCPKNGILKVSLLPLEGKLLINEV